MEEVTGMWNKLGRKVLTGALVFVLAVCPCLSMASVSSIVVGDITGDKALNAKDITSLRRYVVGGYGVTVTPTSLADINDDGSLNAKDITNLRRYVVGGYGVSIDKLSKEAYKDTSLWQASATKTMTDYSAANLIDGETTGEWRASGTSTIEISFPEAIPIKGLRYIAGTKGFWKTASIYGSTNGSDFALIETDTFYGVAGEHADVSFTDTCYRAIRIDVTETSDGLTGAKEIQLIPGVSVPEPQEERGVEEITDMDED